MHRADIFLNYQQKIAEMIESPTIIINLLATSLPQQATYFMQISFVSIVISGGLEALRVLPIALAVLRSFVGPKLTEKEQRTTFMGLRPLYDPLEFQHADITSNAVSLILHQSMNFFLAGVTHVVSFSLSRCSTSWCCSSTRRSRH